MRTEIKKVHQAIPTTTVYVTHDQVEAMTLADRVVVMNGGVIEQVGPPQELYRNPASRFVAGFIGSPAMNFLPARVVGQGSGLAIRLADGQELAVPAARNARYAAWRDREVVFGIRPEHLTEPMTDRGPMTRPDAASMTANVDVVEPMGMETLVHFFVDGSPAAARVDPSTGAAPGQPLPLVADMGQMHVIDPVSQKVV
jgi:multiple sugar transport system ATP-binding protein